MVVVASQTASARIVSERYSACVSAVISRASESERPAAISSSHQGKKWLLRAIGQYSNECSVVVLSHCLLFAQELYGKPPKVHLTNCRLPLLIPNRNTHTSSSFLFVYTSDTREDCIATAIPSPSSTTTSPPPPPSVCSRLLQ